MPTDVVLPQLGESVAEGVITRWLKHLGDTVAMDEPLVEIATDKVNVELPSPAAGIIKELRAEEGETVPVETVIAVIASADEGGPTTDSRAANAARTAEAAIPGPAPERSAEDEIPGRKKSLETDSTVTRNMPVKPHQTGHVNGEKRHYSPLVRRIAEENRLDLDRLVDQGEIRGSGDGDRITKQDVLTFLAQPVPSRQELPSTIQPSNPPTAAKTHTEDDIIVMPLTGMRKLIADHVTHSAFTAPHVTTVAQADVTKLVAFRTSNKELWEKEEGLKLTYTPFFIKAASDALLAFPMVNSSIEGENIIARKFVNMGVAVSLGEGGLIVPVIRHAHSKDLFTIARELEDLAGRARKGQLQPDEIRGGTFTITNPGVFGAIISTPIINSPQSAILGVEAIQKMPVVRDDDSIAIRSMMYLCLSYDHRVIDGETAIKFLQHMRGTLEEFRFFK